MKKVPFIDLTRFESKFLAEVLEDVRAAVEKAQFVGGPQIAELESDLKTFTGASHVVSCANGTDAIQIALRSAGIGRGDRVLVPEMTFWASVEAVINVGADPVCIDVSKNSLHLELSAIKQAVENHQPRALILVHLYGWAAPETIEIREYCRNKKIILIEDSAQAFGTRLNDRDLIAGAEIATTSFYPAKVLGASGDAGALFFASQSLADQARSLCNHGRISHYQHGSVGWNSRVGVFESIYLKHSLKHLKSRIESRRKTLDAYRQNLSTVKGLEILKPVPSVFENGYLNVVQVDSAIRDQLRNHLSDSGIATGVVYPEPMSTQPGYRNLYPGETRPQNAMAISRSILNLPCFPGITSEEINQTCEAIRKFFC